MTTLGMLGGLPGRMGVVLIVINPAGTYNFANKTCRHVCLYATTRGVTDSVEKDSKNWKDNLSHRPSPNKIWRAIYGKITVVLV